MSNNNNPFEKSAGRKTEFPTFERFASLIDLISDNILSENDPSGKEYDELLNNTYNRLKSAHDCIVAEKDAQIFELAKENTIMKEVLHTERQNYATYTKEIAKLREENAELRGRIAETAKHIGKNMENGNSLYGLYPLDVHKILNKILNILEGRTEESKKEEER